MSIIVCDDLSLPRDIDVVVNVSKPQAEVTTDLSVLVFATPNATFDPDANRIQYYSSLSAVTAAGFATSSEVYKAATAFFSQSPRALQMAVGRIFTAATAGYLKMSSVQQTVATWAAVSDGSFTVSLDSVSTDITALDFGAVTDLDDVAAVIQVALNAAVVGTTCVNVGSGVFKIISATTGVTSTVSFLTTVSPASGTDISGSGFLGGAYVIGSSVQTAYLVSGYTPTGLVGEMTLIAQAASCSGLFVYGWALDLSYRDSADAVLAAAWIETQVAVMGLCLNSAAAYDSASTTDIGYLINAAAYTRTYTVYHNNAYYYPEIAILARALGVNYAAANSTITTKFKDLIGIPTVPITETQLTALETKRINTFTAVGNNARTFREGVEANTNWFVDDRINLDNFREEVQTAVYNVFLQNKKVPYTIGGINLIDSAIDAICRRYVSNGTFADRPTTSVDYDKPAILPAYLITFASIASMTVAERAARVGPPATITVQLAGAIHSIVINVEAFA